MNRELLRNEALRYGATAAVFIKAPSISVEDELVEMCRAPGCAGYGKSANCPPHVMGPREAKSFIAGFEEALFFKLDVEPVLLFSDERFRIFELIFRIAAGLEIKARSSGFKKARALAAGSCKPVFCNDEPCDVLSGSGECRHPSLARPSMEALGINVFKLAHGVGWPIHRMTKVSNPGEISSAMVAGILLFSI